MVFSGNELTLSAGAVDEAQAKEIIDIDMDGDDITVAFNPSYLIEGLSAISEPYVRMKLTTAVKPVEFNGQQEADSDESMDYRYLLVPMRFNTKKLITEIPEPEHPLGIRQPCTFRVSHSTTSARGAKSWSISPPA